MLRGEIILYLIHIFFYFAGNIIFKQITFLLSQKSRSTTLICNFAYNMLNYRYNVYCQFSKFPYFLSETCKVKKILNFWIFLSNVNIYKILINSYFIRNMNLFYAYSRHVRMTFEKIILLIKESKFFLCKDGASVSSLIFKSEYIHGPFYRYSKEPLRS